METNYFRKISLSISKDVHIFIYVHKNIKVYMHIYALEACLPDGNNVYELQ